MHDTEYGLTAGVYTPDRAARERILARVDTGTVVLELLRPREPAPAVVGRGHSGLGLTLSTYGIRTFSARRRGTCEAT